MQSLPRLTSVDNNQNMAAAAAWYAANGYAVFPLHTPRSGGGCSCGAPACKSVGKHPRTAGGVADATTDAGTVAEWWGRWPDANIGIACGPSGLLVLDLDEYKSTYGGGGLLEDADLATVTTITGGGGRHVWYAMPAGAFLGNRRGNLPAGIDVRGWGGYVVAAPSLHASGARYAFAPGHNPRQIEIAPLPAQLRAMLEVAARRAPAAHAVATLPADDGSGAPDLARWGLSATILDYIHTPSAPGTRSEVDFAIVAALVAAGAGDGDIAGVFRHYPTSGKFRERGRGGDHYLAHTIGNARAAAREGAGRREQLARLRVWIHSAPCADVLRGAGVARVSDYVRTLDALIELFQARLSPRMVVSMRTLGEARNASHMTAKRHVQRLRDAGLLEVVQDGSGTMISLDPLLRHCDATVTPSPGAPTVRGVTVASQSPATYYVDHRADDAFTPYPAKWAAKRRGVDPASLLRSLNSAALTVAAYLDQHPECTAAAIAGATGLSVPGVRRALGALDDAGLLLIWRGRPCRYKLHPDHEARLDDARPEMTGCGVGPLLAKRNADARAAWADREWAKRVQREPRERAKLEARQDKYNAAAIAAADRLRGLGIDTAVKVILRPPKPRLLRVDPAAGWEAARPIWESWQELIDVPAAERYRLLGFAGWERAEVDAARMMAAKAGKGARAFVGVG